MIKSVSALILGALLFCFAFSNVEASVTPKNRVQCALEHNPILESGRYQTLNALFNGMLQENAAAVLAGAPYPNVFVPGLRFKTLPIIANGDYTLAVEYLFGLTADVFNGASLKDYEIIDFVHSCDRAYARTVLYYMDDFNVPRSRIIIEGIYRYVSNNFTERFLIKEFHMSAEMLEDFWSELGAVPSNPFVQAAVIEEICQIHEDNCTGSMKQYDNYTHCIDFLTNNVSFGTPDNMLTNSAVCRQLHSGLVKKVSPMHHCPHIGQTGGGKCRDYTANEIHAPLFTAEEDPNRLIRYSLTVDPFPFGS